LIEDEEGRRIPIFFQDDNEDECVVIDAHTHIFPEKLMKAVRSFYQKNYWKIRYGDLDTFQSIQFLLDRKMQHLVLLQYAHKEGISRDLNKHMLNICGTFPNRVTGLATVFPGELGAAEILKESFDMGLAGIKMHSHVQCIKPDDPKMEDIYQTCIAFSKPVLFHTGRSPASKGLKCDPMEMCSFKYMETVLKRYPELKICVPHLGMDEIQEYSQLLERYDNLYLDTSMVLSRYFYTVKDDLRVILDKSPLKIMYGSDWPNIPYAYDRELKILKEYQLDKQKLEYILFKNAQKFYSIGTQKSKL